MSHQAKDDGNSEVHRAVEKRAAWIEVERCIGCKRAGGENWNQEHDHLKDLEALLHRVGAKELVAEEPKETPQERIHQAANDRANDEAHALVRFQFGIA